MKTPSRLVTKRYIHPLFSKRKKQSTKGTFGRVLVIGGSDEFTGAAYFTCASALSCLRGGADLVTLASTKLVATSVNHLNPDIITKKFSGKYLADNHFPKLKKAIDCSDVIVIGPGLGQHIKTKKLILKILKKYPNKEKIIDADALKLITFRDVSSSILTPHKKEYEVLLKHSNLNPAQIRKNLSTNVLLIKGAIDTIVSFEFEAKNTTGNPGMTVGGTGDLLAGLLAGLLASTSVSGKIKHRFLCACAASYILGRVGDQLGKSYGPHFIASDFLKVLGRELGTFY